MFTAFEKKYIKITKHQQTVSDLMRFLPCAAHFVKNKHDF